MLTEAERAVVEAAKDVSDGWQAALRGARHHIGCECSGVFGGDEARIERGDFSNLHTCHRLGEDFDRLKEALENVRT